MAVYKQAKHDLPDFIDKASGKPEYDGAVKKTKERMQDIDDTITFLEARPPTRAADAASSRQPHRRQRHGGSTPAAAAPRPPSLHGLLLASDGARLGSYRQSKHEVMRNLP